MAIDASIYGQIRQPEAPNLLAMYGQAQQLQGMQQQNRLAELAFADRERQQGDQTRVRGIYGQGLQGQELENALLKGGFANEALKFGADRRANAKTEADTQATQVGTAGKAFDQYKAMLGTVQDPQQAAQLISASYNDPTIGPLLQRFGTLEEGLRRLQQATSNPQAFAQWKANAAIGMEKLAEMAKVQSTNTGGQTELNSYQPATGQLTPVASFQNTQSPDAQLQANTSRANNTATVGAMNNNAQAVRDAASIAKRGSNEEGLRKEFASLPEVKKLKEAIPAYQAVVKASKINNPQADINLVYGLAKLYDPESVVREGEYATIANSQAIPEWIKGMAQRLVGGGRLTDATKKQIIEQAGIRLGAYQSEVDGARGGYDEIARRGGLDPQNVFVPIGGQVNGGTAPAPTGAGSDPLGIRQPAGGR